jgi:hypothetical protein
VNVHVDDAERSMTKSHWLRACMLAAATSLAVSFR